MADGAHLAVHIEPAGARLCAGTVDYLDRYIERVFDFLDAPIPPDFVVPIEIGNPAAACTSGSANCYDDGTVVIGALDTDGYSGRRPAGVLRHELVHAVHARLWGQSVAFFNEGLAESLSVSSLNTSSSTPRPIGDMLDKRPLELDYAEAGRFVRFLIDTRGLPRFRELFEGAPGRDGAGLRAWIGEVYGESFADIESEYLSGSPRCLYQLDVCDAAAAEPVGDTWSLGTSAACSDIDFYGAADAESRLFATQRTVEVTIGGRYMLRSRYQVAPGDPDDLRSRVLFNRCGTCEEISLHEMKQGDTELDLPAGLYSLEVVVPFDTVISVTLDRIDP